MSTLLIVLCLVCVWLLYWFLRRNNEEATLVHPHDRERVFNNNRSFTIINNSDMPARVVISESTVVVTWENGLTEDLAIPQGIAYCEFILTLEEDAKEQDKK